MASSEYELLELIGHGSFGQIRKIRQLSDNKVSPLGAVRQGQSCQSRQSTQGIGLCCQIHTVLIIFWPKNKTNTYANHYIYRFSFGKKYLTSQ